MNEDRESAFIYNFKEKQTCPMCHFFDLAFDLGGNKLVKDRFGYDYKEHFHDAFGCYWQYLFYSESYNGNTNVDIDELKKEAKNNFKAMAEITGNNFFFKEVKRND